MRASGEAWSGAVDKWRRLSAHAGWMERCDLQGLGAPVAMLVAVSMPAALTLTLTLSPEGGKKYGTHSHLNCYDFRHQTGILRRCLLHHQLLI